MLEGWWSDGLFVFSSSLKVRTGWQHANIKCRGKICFVYWYQSVSVIFCCCCSVKKLNLTKAKQQQGRRIYCGSCLKGHSPPWKGRAGACSWDTSHLRKPATESRMCDVPLPSLFSICPRPYTVGVAHLHGVTPSSVTPLSNCSQIHPQRHI